MLRALFGPVRVQMWVHDEERITDAAITDAALRSRGAQRQCGRGRFGVAHVLQRLPRLAPGLDLRRGREPRGVHPIAYLGSGKAGAWMACRASFRTMVCIRL